MFGFLKETLSAVAVILFLALSGQPPETMVLGIFTARSSGSGSFRVIHGAGQPHLPPVTVSTIRYTVS